MRWLIASLLATTACAACAGPEPGGGPVVVPPGVGGGGGAGGTGGEGPSFTGDVRWSRVISGTHAQELTEVVFVDNRYVAVGSSATSDTDVDGLVVVYDSAGAEVGALTFDAGGTGSAARVARVATYADGGVVVGGNYNGSLTLGSSSLGLSPGAIFVGGVDPGDASPQGDLWSLESTGEIFLGDLETSGTGEVVLCGRYTGAVDVSSSVASPDPHTFVAKLSRQGGAHWIRDLGPVASYGGYRCSVHVEATELVQVWWSFRGDITVSDGQGNEQMAVGNEAGAAGLLSLDPNGSPINLVTLDNADLGGVGGQGGGGGSMSTAVVSAFDFDVDPCGETTCDVIAVGSFTSALPNGQASEGQFDAFVARIGPGGEMRWVKTYGGELSESLEGVVVAPNHDIVLAGYHVGNVDFGGGVLSSLNGDTDFFLVRLDADGDHRWSHSFGDGENTRAYDVRLAPDGTVVAAGTFSGELTFETTHAASGPEFVDRDGFIATFEP